MRFAHLVTFGEKVRCTRCDFVFVVGGDEGPVEAFRASLAPLPARAHPDGTPLATPDGRPFVPGGGKDFSLWIPKPARDGDPIFCCGARAGTFRGDPDTPGGWHLELQVPALPPELAAPLLGSKEMGRA